jgi:hypothetical protein
MRMALGNYLRLAIDRNWELMAAAKESHEARQALGALYAVAIRVMEGGSRYPAIFAEMLKRLETITQSRRVRLYLATGIVPGILWLVLGQTNADFQAMHATLKVGLLFAAVFVYLLMVANYQSFVDPLAVILALPGAGAGILLMLFVTGSERTVVDGMARCRRWASGFAPFLPIQIFSVQFPAKADNLPCSKTNIP